MWFLESDGDVFMGKKLWLRPGTKFLFGRTTAEAGGFEIANKTISKKHLTIEVTSVEKGDGLHLKQRSKVILKDLGSKIGTVVDGQQIRGLERTLDGDSHEIIVGRYEHPLRITWKPVVLSFSFSAKELKNSPLEALGLRLGGLDIKVVSDFIRGSTTHVVAKKRNTAKGLEALINGCYIVDNSFVDAVMAAADRTEGSSLLETDFDTNWPDALTFLPPRSKEPTQRFSSDYHPDPHRQTVFDGYIFVFYEQAQFDTLLGPITSGRGKALLRQAEAGITTVDEFVRYVKSVAGEKGLGEFEDGSEGKGVVVVRYQPTEGLTHSWYSDFGTRVSLLLDHRLVEQNEFLDAILSNDASILRKTLETEQPETTAPSGTAVSTSNPSYPPLRVTYSTSMVEIPEGSASAPTALSRRMGRSRRTVTSRFKGFEDESDTPAIPELSQFQATPAMVSQSQESGMFVSQDQSMNVDQQISEKIVTYSHLSRKRPSSPSIEEEDEEDILDQLAPAAANLKRRRLKEDLARRRRGEPTPPPPVVDAKPQAAKGKPKRLKNDPVDVMEVARQQREKEEEIARAEREALHEAMGDMDIDEIRKLAVIEEMPVRRIAPPPRTSGRADDGDRWDERWNGRKNFKKFKRRGEAGVRAVNKVMVPLEEVKKKDFGIGDEYWLEGDKESQKKKKGKGRTRDSQAISHIETQGVFSRSSGNQADEAEVAQPSDVEHVEVPAVATQRSSATSPAQRSSDKTDASRNQVKRVAEPMTRPEPAKRPRQAARNVNVDSDDSDDGLGFKFRKRR